MRKTGEEIEDEKENEDEDERILRSDVTGQGQNEKCRPEDGCDSVRDPGWHILAPEPADEREN
jgi:hypothetical protein